MAQHQELFDWPFQPPTNPGELADYLHGLIRSLSTMNLRSGANGFKSGKGYFLGFSRGVTGIKDGTPVFYVGDSTGHYIAWDGSEFNVVGKLTAKSGSIEGALTVGTGGSLSSGQTAYNTGIGFWWEDNGGTPRISVGDPSGAHWTWDGTAFKIYNSAGTLVFNSTSLLYPDGSTVESLQPAESGAQTFDGKSPDTLIDGTNIKLFRYGTLAARPAAGTAGRIYHATDSGTNGETFRDTGTVWQKIGVGHLGDADGSLDNVGDGSTYKRTTANEKTGAGRGYAALDSGNIIVAGSVDFSRSYTNKHLDNVPDGTTYKRTTANEKTGAGRGYNAIDSGGVIVAGAVDFSRSYANKHLDNIPDGTTYKRTTANEKTGAGRGYNAIDSGNVIVASGIDFSRSYTGKHLGNVPDDATGRRYAAIEAGAQKFDGKSITKLVDRVAANVEYGAAGSGVTLESLKPAEAAAQQTAGKSLTVLTDTNTSNLSDDAGLGSSAAWGGVSGVPDTIPGHNLAGVVQPALPAATSNEQALVSDASGNVFWSDRYGGPALGAAFLNYLSADTDIHSFGSFTDIGDTAIIPDPGRPVFVLAFANLHCHSAQTTPSWYAGLQIAASFDGGVSWTARGQTNAVESNFNGDTHVSVATSAAWSGAGGDIQVKVQVDCGDATLPVDAYANDCHLTVLVIPQTDTFTSSTLSAPLSASISNDSGAATATYPSTQPTCTTTFPVTSSGGVGAKHYSAAITAQPSAGTATLINASTASPQVQLTGATATEGGTTYQTGVSETVTDSATPTPASVTSTATISQTLYLVYAAITGSISAQGGGCSRYSGNACTATGSATENLNGGNGSYTYVWTITGQTLGGATLTGASLKTCSVSGTATVGQTNVVSVRCNANDSRNTGQITTTGSIKLTYHDNGPRPT